MIKSITVDDAFLILDKLRCDAAPVLCVGKLFGWRFALKGNISALSKTEVFLVSVDNPASVALRLDMGDTDFWYSEPKDMPSPDRDFVPEYARDSASLVVGLPLRVAPSELSDLELPRREKIFFMELRKPDK